jgi:hypothetical protein
MSTATSRTRSLVTLVMGTVASAAIWLAGAHDVAFLGYVLAALAREPVHGRACPRRPARGGTS